MRPATPLRDSAALRRLRAEVEAWRGRPNRGRALPAAVWSGAVPLARKHGAYRVARAVGLSYASLKHRLDAAVASDPPPSARFVELVASPPPDPPSAVIELEAPGDHRLRVELRGGTPVDLATLLRELWQVAR